MSPSPVAPLHFNLCCLSSSVNSIRHHRPAQKQNIIDTHTPHLSWPLSSSITVKYRKLPAAEVRPRRIKSPLKWESGIKSSTLERVLPMAMEGSWWWWSAPCSCCCWPSTPIHHYPRVNRIMNEGEYSSLTHGGHASGRSNQGPFTVHQRMIISGYYSGRWKQDSVVILGLR